jgi:hypothetical protein
MRALRGRRLAYALIAEPVDPEVETVSFTAHNSLVLSSASCGRASCEAYFHAWIPP